MAKRLARPKFGLTRSILHRLRAQGMTVGQIADKFGTTRMTIYRRFNDTVKATTRIKRDK